VLDAALEVLAARGLEGLNLRAVAARLKASAGTLYNYFDNKQALLEAVLARVLDPVLCGEVGIDDWRADLRTVLVAFNGALRAHPAAVALLSAGVGAERMDPIRERLLGLLFEAGLSGPDQVRALNMVIAHTIGDVVVHQSHLRSHGPAELARRRSLPADVYPHVHETAHMDLAEPDTDAFLLGLDALLDTVASAHNVG
jgi:AcrR family transcriptional regulator